MALVFIDGFDHYHTEEYKWDNVIASVAPQDGLGRFGNGAMAFTGTNLGVTVNKTLDVAIADCVWGIAYWTENAGSAHTVMQFLDSGGVEIGRVGFNAGGGFDLYRGGSTVVASTANSLIGATTWQFIEVKYVPKNSGGTIEIRVDGVVEATFSGDTTDGAENDIAEIKLGSNIAGFDDVRYDDMYLLDSSGTSNNDYLGDVRVITTYPTASDTHTDFTTTGAATAHEAVDEDFTIDDDTSYIENGSIGAQHSFTTGANGVTATVFGVQVSTCAKKSDTISRAFKNTLKVGSTEIEGIEHQLTVAYKVYTDIEDVNPDTSTAWDVSTADSAVIGVKVTT
jgi:hypothetical protein